MVIILLLLYDDLQKEWFDKSCWQRNGVFERFSTEVDCDEGTFS